MFAKLISHLPAPLLRACAYAKAFALLEDPSMPAHGRPRTYEPHRHETATAGPAVTAGTASTANASMPAVTASTADATMPAVTASTADATMPAVTASTADATVPAVTSLTAGAVPCDATTQLPTPSREHRPSSCADGRHRALPARRAPRRDGGVPANLQPCSTPIAQSPAIARSTAPAGRAQRRTGRPCGRPVTK